MTSNTSRENVWEAEAGDLTASITDTFSRYNGILHERGERVTQAERLTPDVTSWQYRMHLMPSSPLPELSDTLEIPSTAEPFSETIELYGIGGYREDRLKHVLGATMLGYVRVPKRILRQGSPISAIYTELWQLHLNTPYQPVIYRPQEFSLKGWRLSSSDAWDQYYETDPEDTHYAEICEKVRDKLEQDRNLVDAEGIPLAADASIKASSTGSPNEQVHITAFMTALTGALDRYTKRA